MRFYKLYLLGSNKVYFMCKLYVASNCNGVGYDYSFNDFLTVWYFTLYRICMDTIVSMVQRTANVFVISKAAMKNVPNLLHTTYQFGFIHLLFNNSLSGHQIFRLLNDQSTLYILKSFCWAQLYKHIQLPSTTLQQYMLSLILQQT